MSIENGVVICDGEPAYWHVPIDRSECYIPDSQHLWEVIWDVRKSLDGFAHSHPGSGTPSPSTTDLTTFAAIEKALGKSLKWWIVSEDSMIMVSMVKIGSVDFEFSTVVSNLEPKWVSHLRRLSYNKGEVK